MHTVIIDVRTTKEFQEGSYPGAVNIPSGEFNVNQFTPYKNDHISLVCFSGSRAKKVKSLLEMEGFSHISLMQNQLSQLTEGPKANNSIWTVDRQFRLALGLLLGIFLVGNYIFSSPLSLILLLVIFTGLIYSAVSDTCYLKLLIAILPWNRNDRNKTSAKQNQDSLQLTGLVSTGEID